MMRADLIIQLICVPPAVISALAFGLWPVAKAIHQRIETGKWYPTGTEK